MKKSKKKIKKAKNKAKKTVKKDEKEKIKTPPKRIHFLRRKKNATEKFNDITGSLKHGSFVHKKGEKTFSKAKFYKNIEKKFGFKKEAIKRIVSGKPYKNDIKKIEKFFKKSKYENETKESQFAFNKHNFTLDSFFYKNIKANRTKNEQYLFRCGIRIIFKSKNSGRYYVDPYTKEVFQGYEIPHLPISMHSFDKGKKGFKDFYSWIKNIVFDYPSMMFFTFLYFDVTIYDTTSL